MNLLISCAAVVAMALTAAGVLSDEKKGDKAAAKAFAPKGQGFSVAFPVAHKTVEKKVESSDGTQQTLKLYVAEPAEDRALLVAVVKVAEGDDADKDEYLDAAVSGFVEAAGGGSATVKRAVLSGHAGRSFEFETEGGVAVRGRAYVANGRLYQIAVSGPEAFTSGDAATKFLDSFKLTGPAGKHRD